MIRCPKPGEKIPPFIGNPSDKNSGGLLKLLIDLLTKKK